MNKGQKKQEDTEGCQPVPHKQPNPVQLYPLLPALWLLFTPYFIALFYCHRPTYTLELLKAMAVLQCAEVSIWLALKRKQTTGSFHHQRHHTTTRATTSTAPTHPPTSQHATSPPPPQATHASPYLPSGGRMGSSSSTASSS